MNESGSIRLTDAHRDQIVEAGRRMRRVRRAVSFARFHAAMIMFFGMLTLAIVALQMAFGDFGVVPLLLGAGLVAVGLNEFWGGLLVERLQLRGPIVLAAGEIGLALLIIWYCVWSLVRLEGPPVLMPSQREMLRETFGDLDFEGLFERLTQLVFAMAIGTTALYQGLVSVYYLTRRGPIRKYVRQTPAWIVEIDRLRAGG